MADKKTQTPNDTQTQEFDPAEWPRTMMELSERGQKLMAEFWAQQQNTSDATQPNIDSMNTNKAFTEMMQAMIANPDEVIKAQTVLWQNYMTLWQNTSQRLLGEKAESVIEPEKSDKRFKDEAWSENALFDFIKQSYLLTSNFINTTVHDVEGLDKADAQKVDFYSRQFIDAMAPTNFLATNPAALRETAETKGENLVHGLENLLDDLERGKGKLRISMTDSEAFEVGGNIATSPGQVVFQNDLIQLIHYEPTTKQVHKTPLLIIPPWINKFYILDLKAKNSFIKWAVDQGQSVFVISWINPDEKLRGKNFVNYMKEGPLAALDAIEASIGEKQCNVIGYCLGGTLLASTLAYMKAKGTEKRVKSATYFTTMIDFENAGELSIFVDEEQLSAMEEEMAERGYLDGSEMAATFNMLRSNDLIWSFVVNNYLMGKQPFPFDLLYWNSDSTRMPAAMHSFYLRNMYLENNLIKPGGITLDGVKIDLRTIETPSFILSTKEDHIAPWQATYVGKNTYAGPVKFVLSGSGHIAGVINPPSDKMKYGYWTNDSKTKDPDTWLKGASEHPGSWWPEWDKWISKHGGKKILARKPADSMLPPIEAAPGSYVKIRAG